MSIRSNRSIFSPTCHVKPFGHPPGVDAERFHLIAPYEANSREWLRNTWIDQYSGENYRITTTGHHGDRHTARVKTYGEVLREYEIHPESKCADASGRPCGKQTAGLLQRRHVRIDQIKYIGKESNSLEEVGAGLEHSAENVYTLYPDQPTRRMANENSARVEENTSSNSRRDERVVAQGSHVRTWWEKAAASSQSGTAGSNRPRTWNDLRRRVLSRDHSGQLQNR